MSQNKAYLLSLNDSSVADQWDFGFVQDFLHDNSFEIEQVTKIPKGDRAIVILPARHHAGQEQVINDMLGNLNHPLLFLLGDEEADFDVSKIELDAKYIWVQNPHLDKHDAYHRLGTGYPKHMRANLPDTMRKNLNVYFAGQMTHQRRRELIDILLDYQTSFDPSTLVIRTQGFTQGEEPKDYYAHMTSAKVAPAPSGAVIPDSFRLFEALECMAIPIADQRTPSGEVLDNYWDWLFEGDTPFPKITEWDRLFGLIPEILEDYPRNMHQQTSWYLLWKRKFRDEVLEAYNA